MASMAAMTMASMTTMAGTGLGGLERERHECGNQQSRRGGGSRHETGPTARSSQ